MRRAPLKHAKLDFACRIDLDSTKYGRQKMTTTNPMRAACVAAIFAVASWSGVAQAQSTTSYPVSGTCTGAGQLCNSIPSVGVSTTGLLQAQFTLSAAACSNVRIHWLVDGTEVAVSGFVGPTATTTVSNLGPVTSGTHTVGLQAEGQVGGCNAGTLAAWAGTAQITTQTTIAATGPIATPTLGEWGLGALGIMLAMAAALGLRGRRS
jgi:hypothetical protein